LDKFPSRAREAAVSLEPRVSAVVVARGVEQSSAQAPLDLCIRSALAEPLIDDLVVVDAGNSEAVAAGLRALQADRRDVRLVVAEPGVGAAAAANLGARYALGRWILFLDASVVLQRNAVSRMAAASGGAPTPWIVGGRLTDAEGREQRAARGGALTTWSAIGEALDWPAPKPPRRRRKGSEKGDPPAATKVAAVSGALMLIPRGDFQSLGGFDEGFDGAYADLDLCRRAAEAGGRVLFQPDAGGVQLQRGDPTRRQARDLAHFVAKSAKTPFQRAFAMVAKPALTVLVLFKDLVIGRRPRPRRR